MANFGNISTALALGAGESLRRNAGNTDFEAFTPSTGGFSWNTTANGATGTGLALSMDNSYAASGIGQRIVLGNTQTNAVTLMELDTGTSVVSHIALNIKSPNAPITNGAISINAYASNTQCLRNLSNGLVIGRNFNSNSSNRFTAIYLNVDNNAGSGRNSGITVSNNLSTFQAGTENSVNCTGASYATFMLGNGGVGYYGIITNSVSATTTGIAYYKIGDTQSASHVAQKIDMGSSAQAHIAYLANGSNASSTAVAFNANMSTGYTGKLFRGAVNSVEKFVVNADGSIVTTPLISAAAGYLNIPQNSQSAAYTTVASDSGKHIYHPSADTTARTWTIDSNANVAYPIGTAITFVNDTSGGVITIAITSDTLVLAGAGTTGSRTLAANGVATAIKVTSTRWQISGTGLT